VVGRRMGHPYWLWEAIMGSPQVLAACLAPEEAVKIDRVADRIVGLRPAHMYLTGTGSSRFAGLVTAQALSELTELPATVHTSSEFQAYPPAGLGPESVVIATSHSGVTPGDVPAMESARSCGAFTIGITNYRESALAQVVDEVIVGPDTPILRLRTTRSYNGNIVRGLQLSIALGKRLGRGEKAEAYQRDLLQCPSVLESCLAEYAPLVPEVARELLHSSVYFVVAAGPNMSTAHETALGFYQGTGVGARALQVEEFLHGSVQAMREEMCLVAIAAPGPLQRRILQAVEAVKAIGGRTLIIAPKDTPGMQMADVPIPMPAGIPELLTPVIYTGPLWQIGYHFSLLTNRDPDYMEMMDEAHMQALASLMPEGSQFDRWAGRVD
jgi:glucosamine--fructose-6-phosphate aminotransferase (isomerizing)